VTVDRADPRRVKIHWDEIESSGGDGVREAEALAAAMRGPRGPGAARPPVVGLDPSLAVDPALQQPGVPVRPPQEAVTNADHEVDDQLARLAKLGQLRDAGVLTPEEFEQEKRKILGGG
jgi:hypothetical protein